MPDLHISEAPAMIRHLVAARAFADNPIVVVDVGARGEIEPLWSVFGDQIRIIGFEPDPSECERLNAEAGPNVCYLPIALSSDVGEATFYTTNHAASSSLYKADPASTARFNFAENLAVQSEASLQTSTLTIALGDRKPDFIKLDAEGAELKILRGANLDAVLGILSEVNFLSAVSTFAELDVFCRDAGFQLYDLDLYRFSRSALPYPFLYDFREEHGRPCAGPTIQGQLLTGDALYFLDGVRTKQPLKLACLFELFGLNDCAAEVIISHDLDRQLLEFLTPKVKGTKFSYTEYVRRSQANDARFRPTYPYRFPECVLGRYDGTFTPRWHPLSRLIAFLNRMFKC